MISEKHCCFYAALLNIRKKFTYFLFTNLDFLKVHLWKDLKNEICNDRGVEFFGPVKVFLYSS